MMQGMWTRDIHIYIQAIYKHSRPLLTVSVFYLHDQEYGRCVKCSCTNLEVIFRNGDTATRANTLTSVHASPVITPIDRVVVCSINTIPVSKSTHDHTIEFSMQFMIMQQSRYRMLVCIVHNYVNQLCSYRTSTTTHVAIELLKNSNLSRRIGPWVGRTDSTCRKKTFSFSIVFQ